ncbi:hypothetical protein HD806DRAFT_541551 [Xylariaceae sp. AK1471]|nr:hypothetical protein HD806DRAFT_541551 [Xylariaceae sp. AK1471]
MDPLTAVSLAAAVVQFTDYGVRLLSEGVRVYKSVSGMTSDVVELTTIAQDLGHLSQSIQEKSSQLTDPRKPISESEQSLLRLCGTCQNVSAELATAVSRLQTQSTKKLNLAVESFEVALRKFWARDRIVDLRNRLSEIRQQMMMAMMMYLWEESKSGAGDLGELSRRQAEMINTLTRIDVTTRNLNQTLVKFVQGSMPMDWRQQEIVETIWSSTWSPDQPVHDEVRREEPETQEIISNTNSDSSCSKDVLNSLFFEGLSYREGAILQAYKSTFEWLFTDPRVDRRGRPLWSNFTSWLKSSDSDIYWITGKPGSGKSTLMKFLTGHLRLRDLLTQWSGSRPFILARFYFWNAGTAIQRTQEGLLRTLLYQCLTQRPQLIPKVCPRRWALFKVFGRKANHVAPSWTWEELLESFSAFDLFVGQQFNLAIFIDGLDEFDGKHENLLEFVNLFHSKAGRKICVSSRPWNVFHDAFMTNPSLRLENLTGGDIGAYVRGNLESSPGFREYKVALPVQSDKLVETIITKAQGVFLWVSIVILAILEGLSEGDKWEELHEMVGLLPPDLSQLYQRIWFRIKPSYIGHSSQLFQIYQASTGQLDVITMWLADHRSPLEIDINAIDTQQRTLLTQTMRRRLNSRTRGLLEISSEGRIGYLHRSVRDWIEPIWADIVAKSRPDFDPNLCLLKALTVEASRTRFWLQHVISLPDRFWERVQDCLRYAAKVRDIRTNVPSLVEAMDRLDVVFSTISLSHTFGNSTPPLYEEAISARCPYKRNGLPHWSTTQGRDLPDNSFIGLAAQFAILGYVRDKVTASPQVLQPTSEELSILANAVLGPEYFLRQKFKTDESDPLLNSNTRYFFVKFLLESGASKTSAWVPGGFRHTALHDEVIRRPFQAPPIMMPDGSQLDYWSAVAQLLKDFGLLKAGIIDLKLKLRLPKWMSR